MSETATIGPVIREEGNNPLPDGNQSIRVDARSGLLPRLGRVFWPGNEGSPTKQTPPQPAVPPAEELAQQRALLEHLQGQLRSAKATLAGDPSRPSSTAMIAGHMTTQHYVKMLCELADVAVMPLVDLPLLVNILERPGEGLIPAVAQRVAQLENHLRIAPRPADEHRRLIAGCEKTLKAWGKAYIVLRNFEQNVSPSARHEFRGPRPVVGFDFGHIDAKTLDRVAAFAASLPDGK